MRYLLILATLLTIGCKAGPGKDSGFIEQPEDMVDASKVTPFHRGWASEYWKENRLSYNRMIVAPVNTDYIAKSDWWQRQNAQTKSQLEEGRQQIAEYMREKVIETFQKDPHKRYEIVESAGPKTIVLEIALVELTPAKVFFNAAGTLSSLVIPGAGIVTGATGKGTVAFEARLVDAKTGEVHAKFADREKDKTAPINLAQYSWNQGSKQNISDWAKQFVMVANAKGERVKDSRPFTLKPW